MTAPSGKDVQRGQSPLVLVVEDEPVLRMMAVDLVEEAGFAVVEAPDADKAIDLLERHDDIRILFSDIRMPGTMDGFTLAQAVRDRWPGVGIILTSGHCAMTEIDLPPDDIFFTKPYDFRVLEAALHRLAV